MEKSVQLSNFAIIDVSLFQDKRLSSTDCCVYGLISSLSNNDIRACYASNNYLSKIKNITKRNIQKSIVRLKKYDYIKIDYNKNKRIIRTYVDYQILKRNEENGLKQNLCEEDEEVLAYNWLDSKEE